MKQRDRVREYVERMGFASRNYFLAVYPAIINLPARIQELEAEGYKFNAGYEYGDYVYRLVARPIPKQMTIYDK